MPQRTIRLDLERLTRDTMARMEQDLGAPLESVAAVHYNTDHPHVHVALHGVRSGGQQLQMSQDYILPCAMRRSGLSETATDHTVNESECL